MDPVIIAREILNLMTHYCESLEGDPPELSPMEIMLGSTNGTIDPSAHSTLAAAGVAQVVAWITKLSELGFVGSVGPVPTGWYRFAPSKLFIENFRKVVGVVVISQTMDVLFPPEVATPSAGSMAALAFRNELHGSEYEKLRVVLKELEVTALHRCRHASIALCGKLVESGLKFKLEAVLSSHEFQRIEKSGLAELSSTLVRLRSNEHIAPETRTEIQRLVELGTVDLLNLIRGYRNGVVHWSDAEIPTENMAEAIVLFTVDVLRVFYFGSDAPSPFSAVLKDQT